MREVPMSRPIKFRAWDGRTMRVLKVLQIDTIGEPGSMVMQFTGLTDKNGKEIYEGDVLRFTLRETLHEVAWEEKYACFTLFKVENEERREVWYPNRELDCPRLEVIGNIYETPELLNV